MKNKIPQKPIITSKQNQERLKPSYYMLMLAYLIVPVFVPSFNTFDTNGPKFLALALINIASFIILFNDPDYRKRPEVQIRFFRTYIGIAYALFMVISLLSFFNAINLVESLLNLIKALTIFGSTYILYVIFSSNRGYLLHLASALSMLLIIDSLSVFYNMLMYISREVTSIMDIKTVYSHKNILASALFIKLPASIFLIFFSRGWQKGLGYIAGLMTVLSILLLSTRAFYLGLALLMILLFVFALIRQVVAGKKGAMRNIAIFAATFVVALLLYSAAQRVLFPKNTDTIWNTGIVSRLGSIKADESSTHARLTLWNWSVQIIRENPLLGVGTGNWKLIIMKYYTQRSTDFIVPYKNHNDFLEITAETGLIGGLTFISIFLLILFGFSRALIKSKIDDDRMKLMFLPAFGIVAYSVDAFFNFPADRPDIQSLFAIYVALGAACSGMEITSKQDNPVRPLTGLVNNRWIRSLAIIGLSLLLIASAWILFLNVKSLRYQYEVNEDFESNKLTHASSLIMEGFPFIPTVSSLGEPIAVIKAQYLMNEKRFQDAVSLLMKDASSPYDSRREYNICRAYNMAGMDDSAFVWAQRAYPIKPFHNQLVRILSIWLFNKGQHQQSQKIMSEYLSQVKNDAEMWNLAVNQLWANKQYEKAIIMLDTAIKYLPEEKSIMQQHDEANIKLKIVPYDELYDQIVQLINLKNYKDAIRLLNDLLEKKPQCAEAYLNRARCLSETGAYAESNKDIDKAIEFGIQNIDVINNKGVNFLNMGNIEAACQNFKVAMEKGSKMGETNYKKYCGSK